MQRIFGKKNESECRGWTKENKERKIGFGEWPRIYTWILFSAFPHVRNFYFELELCAMLKIHVCVHCLSLRGYKIHINKISCKDKKMYGFEFFLPHSLFDDKKNLKDLDIAECNENFDNFEPIKKLF